MAFVVSARKYRPDKFVDVVGQQHVTTTLKNAIKNDKLAHSFLFCGPRGVGKTTCARILAKTLNCQNPSSDFEPCGTCTSCQSFEQSASFNIFELDAASNNSVDDIRNLIDQVRFAPQAGKYKIYIIDEVHMLSQAAFNAFLKTLEEPPSYAIFILATTEKHKIIPTILSRCQIFDFGRIRVEDMVQHLKSICAQESIEAEDDALFLIAQKADGGLRDSLSIFDRIASYSEGKIGYNNVIESLNILDYDYFFQVTDSLLIQDTSSSLLLYNEILKKGFEADNFISGLCAHFRNLLVCKDSKTLDLLEVTEGLKDRYQEQAKLASSSFLLSSLNLANQCAQLIRTAQNKRLQVELCLLKIAHIPSILSSKLPISPPLAHISQGGNFEQAQSVLEKKKPELTEEAKKSVPEEKKTETPEEIPVKTEGKVNLLEQSRPSKASSVSLSSLNDLHKKQAAEDKAKELKVLDAQSKEALSESQVKEEWTNYGNQIELHSVKSLFQKSMPEIDSEAMLLNITVTSELQKEMLGEETQRFLRFLEKRHSQATYSISFKVVQKEEESNRPKELLSPKEVYKSMMSQNPLLKDLIQRLNLEVEY